MFCNIEIDLEEKSKRMKVMIDTGNMLKDPISNMPVVVVEQEELIGLIPNEVLDNLKGILNGNKEEKIDEQYISRFKIIPFSSIGKENGILLGIRVDSIKIYLEDEMENEENELKIKKIENAIVGIYDKKICKSGQYQGLIGLDLINNQA